VVFRLIFMVEQFRDEILAFRANHLLAMLEVYFFWATRKYTPSGRLTTNSNRVLPFSSFLNSIRMRVSVPTTLLEFETSK
jgi:hypothetical protein